VLPKGGKTKEEKGKTSKNEEGGGRARGEGKQKKPGYLPLIREEKNGELTARPKGD